MTLKETDNHSAQGIFESLMLDPDLEIGEGQTREEAAKQEAEFRSRQHFNNMRALSLGTEESPVKSLLDFISRPSSMWSAAVDLMKASFKEVKSGAYYQQKKKAHPHSESAVSLSEEGQKFVDFLQQNNMPAATIDYVKSLAKVWREDSDATDEDGWIKHVSASIGTHDELSNQLSNANNGGFGVKAQQELSKTLHENGYHAHAPAPKAKTVNQQWFDGERYGSNTQNDLEQTATLDNVNAALQKMGRKEEVHFGGSHKLKFNEETGNVQQWKAYKEAPTNDKRRYTRIVKGQIHTGSTDPKGEILAAQMEDYSVAEILRGLFHHIDMDGGQHDVTPEEAVQNNVKDEATQEKLEVYDAAEEKIVTDEIANGNAEPITNDELEKIMHQFQTSKAAEEIDKSLPFVLGWDEGQMQTPEDIEMHSLAQQFGLTNKGDKVVTPEHLEGIHQAIKDGVLTTGNIVKKWPNKKDAAGNPIPSTFDKSGGPAYYTLMANKKGGVSGVHAYINHKKAKPVVPPKTAKQIADAPTEELGEGKPATLNEVADMAEENNEDFPVKNHVNDDTNMKQTMSAAVEGLFGEMSETYMNSNYTKAAESYSGLSSVGASVGGLFDRFWSKGSIGLGSTLSQSLAERLQANPHLIMATPGLINNSKFISHLDLGYSDALSPEIQQHVKDVQGLHAMAAILNDPNQLKALQKAGTLGAVIKSTMAQVHTVINNPNIPALGDMNPTYITHALEEKAENFATVLENTFGGPQEMASSLKVIASVLGDTSGANSLAKTFGSELNDHHHGIYDNIDDLHNEIDKAYVPSEQKLQDEESSLHISGPAHVEMMNHVDNFMHSDDTSAGTDDQIAAVSAIKDTLQGELSSMATQHLWESQLPFSFLPQTLGLKEKQQIFHNMHTALDAGLVENGHFNEDFSDVSNDAKHKLNSLHNTLNNTFNEEMGDPMAAGDWDAIKGYHAAKSLLESKLAGKPINSMGALHLDNSALDALSDLGSVMSSFDADGNMVHADLSHNIQMFMTDLLSEYSPEQHQQLKKETNMLMTHLEHTAYNPAAKLQDTPGYEYAQEHHGEFASQIKDDHETNIAELSDIAVSVGKLAASPFPQQGIEQHHQDALDALHNGIKDAVDAGTMTEGQAQKIAVDAGIPKKHFTGSDAVSDISTDLADTKRVNMEPDYEDEALKSIADAAHNLNIAVKSGNTDAQNEASKMLTDLQDVVSGQWELFGNEDEFDELLGGHLTSEAYNLHVEGQEPSPVHPEGRSDLGDDYDLGEEEPEEDEEEGVHATVQDVKDAAQEFNEAVDIGDPDDVSQANQKLKKVKEVALAHPNSNVTSAQLDSLVSDELDDKAASEHFAGKIPDKPEVEAKPEVEEPKVEEELDKVPDADASQEKQKQEIMQEIFNDDFKDSDDAKTYKAYLDKQKPEKIDALHETHVIGNLVKKNIKAKANKANQKIQDKKAEEKASEKEEADQTKAEEKQQKEDDKSEQKEADTVPHKAAEIEKKVKEGQNPKQMARDNMVHQHQYGDKMSAKATKEHTDAFHKFEAAGVDMDELLDEKDKHGDAYGSEEHLQAAMKEDAVKEDTAENYEKHIESKDGEHVKNREKAFRAGQPGKFTTFDKNGNPDKDLHHTKDKYGMSSLEEHEHGEGPTAEKFNTQTGEEHGTHTLHEEGGKIPGEDAKKYAEAEKSYKDKSSHSEDLHKKAYQLHEDLLLQQAKLDIVDDDSPDAEGKKSEINDKISQIEKDKETNLADKADAEEERHTAKKALDELPKPKEEPSEDDVSKTGPPDPEVARRKMAEGYIWHEETRSWIMRENLKAIQGGHGAKDATMIHGGSFHGVKAGQMVKPFATNEDGSASDSHFVVSHAGVHKVGAASATPPSASSHQHTTEASLGHALKDTKTGPNGATHLPQAFGAGGALASSGLATAGNQVTQQPQYKGAVGSAMDSIKGGAMDKLQEILSPSSKGYDPKKDSTVIMNAYKTPGAIDFKKQEEEESALDKLLVKYK